MGSGITLTPAQPVIAMPSIEQLSGKASTSHIYPNSSSKEDLNPGK
jgi:hypothetical protein